MIISSGLYDLIIQENKKYQVKSTRNLFIIFKMYKNSYVKIKSLKE